MRAQFQLDPTLDIASDWLERIAALTGGRADLAFAVLRAGLHALRDRLPETDGLAVAQDLPALFRGVWFESWTPRAHVVDATFPDWLVTLEGHLLAADADAVPAREAAEALFAVLACSLGEEAQRRLRAQLPPGMAALLKAD